MALTQHDTKHIAHLARLDLSDEELAVYTTQLSSILAYVEQLNTVDTAGIEYHYQVPGLEHAMAVDEVNACDAQTRAALMDTVPARTGEVIKVKAVFGA